VRSLGAALVALAAVVQTLVLGPAVVMLDVALVVSWALWASRPAAPSRRAVPALAAAIVVQCAHLAEEYRAGFQRALPALFGYAWSDARFLAVNAAWLAVFAASLWAVRHRGRAASLGALGATFLALGGGVGNGLAHLVLALRAGGYFPGLYTAPLCLAAGALLLVRLLASPDDGGGRA